MTTNLTQNFNQLDHNILSYGLILGSLTIIGFTFYYFSSNIFNQNVDMVTDNLPNSISQETITQNIVNNLKTQTITGSDTVVPKLDRFTEASLNKVEACVQTGSGILNRTDIDVTRYTDQGLFIPWDGNLKDAMQELLYGMASDNPSIT